MHGLVTGATVSRKRVAFDLVGVAERAVSEAFCDVALHLFTGQVFSLTHGKAFLEKSLGGGVKTFASTPPPPPPAFTMQETGMV